MSTASTRRDRAACAACPLPCTSCAYCAAPLSSRHEHDHFPVPVRHGGKETLPICINCHDLKDRIDLDDWPATALRVFGELPPIARILMAKLVNEIQDLKADLAALGAVSSTSEDEE